jgi:hypothetical protein
MLRVAVYPQYNNNLGLTMATGKTATLTFRIEPALKEALRTAAEIEHRSIANMVEVMIREHCSRHGIAIHETAPLFPEAHEAPSSGATPKD